MLLFSTKQQNKWKKHLNNLNSESLKVGLKIHKGKTKYMTNHADNEDLLIDQQKIEKLTEFKYLGQTTHLKDATKEEIYARIRAAWSCFGKKQGNLQDKQLPISHKKQVMDQCILPTMTYGCQTCSLNKHMTNRLRTAQRAMERKMLDLKLKDKIPCSEIRKRTKIIDIIEYTLKQKWKWAGHTARLRDNRWTKRCTEWQPRRGKRSRGRPSRRWQDDITEKEGTTGLGQQQTDDIGRHWWRAASCSGWTKHRWWCVCVCVCARVCVRTHRDADLCLCVGPSHRRGHTSGVRSSQLSAGDGVRSLQHHGVWWDVSQRHRLHQSAAGCPQRHHLLHTACWVSYHLSAYCTVGRR